MNLFFLLVEVAIPEFAGQIISICLMAVTILIGNRVVLKNKPAPYRQALVIAVTCNLLGKLFVSVLHFPVYASYSLPTITYFFLSWYFFRPSVRKMFVYWVVGFTAYLAIHILITVFLDWTFMFPFWDVRKSI